MRQISRPLLFLAFCCLTVTFLIGCAQTAATNSFGQGSVSERALVTVVYVVRHAEKDAGNPQDQNPDLSAEGLERAQELTKRLQGVPVQAVYSTKYQRTQRTLQPLAQAKSLTVQIYEASDFNGLAQKIKGEHAGQTVVVAGHSNTVLPIIEALGTKVPLAQIAEHQYNYLFKVTIKQGEEPQVDVLSYGAPSPAAPNK